MELYNDEDPDYVQASLSFKVDPPSTITAPYIGFGQRNPNEHQSFDNRSRNNQSQRNYQTNQRNQPNPYHKNDRTYDNRYNRSQQQQQFMDLTGYKPTQKVRNNNYNQNMRHQTVRPVAVAEVNINKPNYDKYMFQSIDVPLSNPKPFDLNGEQSSEILQLKIKDGPETNCILYEKDVFQTTPTLKENLIKAIQHNSFSIQRLRKNRIPLSDLGNLIFLSDRAVHLACIDKSFQLVKKPPNSLRFYFAEIGSEPGYFSEYLLYRFHSNFRGVLVAGLAVPLENSRGSVPKFNVHKIHPSIRDKAQLQVVDQTPLTFDGIQSTIKLVYETTNNAKLDLIVVDSPNTSKYDELDNPQLQSLLLLRIILVLCSLRQGGDCVFKINEANYSFMHHLLFLLRHHFRKLTVLRPVLQNPLTTERYLVLQELFCTPTPALLTHLWQALSTLNPSPPTSLPPSLVYLFEPSVVAKDTELTEYLKSSNVKLALKNNDALLLLTKAANNKLVTPLHPLENLKSFARYEFDLDPPSFE